MKNTRLPLLLFLAILFVGCTKDSTEVIIETEDPPSIKLHYPLMNDVVDYCCTEFTWSSDSGLDDHTLVISEDEDFEEIVFTTDHLNESITIIEYLKQETKYYWKVSSASIDAEDVGSFEVKSYIDDYIGTYNATVREYVENETGHIISDTTYMRELSIKKDGRYIEFWGRYNDYDALIRENGKFSFWDYREWEIHPDYAWGDFNVINETLWYIELDKEEVDYFTEIKIDLKK